MSLSRSCVGLARLAVLLSLLPSLLLAPAPPVAAGTPPETPVITSPAPTDVGAEDVHMEIGATFSDPDGDTHAATDWEIRAENGVVVWTALDSPELVHAHFDDGQFTGPLLGARQLRPRTAYLFRVRFKDSRGDYSAWAEQKFTTRGQVLIPARQVAGILAQPAPHWRSDGQVPIALPLGARLQLETGSSDLLYTLIGLGDGLEGQAAPPVAQDDALRLRLLAPADAAVDLPSSQLTLVTGLAERVTAYLPALQVPAGGQRILWVSETGATFYGEQDQSHPDRKRLARDVPVPWRVAPGYRIEAVGAAYQMPTSLAVVPDPGSDPTAPRLYVTELYDRIKVVTNDGRVFNFAEDLLNVNPTGAFPGSGEMGVIGVCLPPQGRDVYATTIFRDTAGSLRNKLVRIRSDDGLKAKGVDDVLVVRSGQGLARASHQIQQCSFGPDGKLYVFMADGPTPDNALDDKSFGGKVLRLNPDGSAPTDNPFYDPANPTAPISYQLTKGHRNAFGMAWRPSDGKLYLSENGPNVDRLVRVTPGLSYGWDGSDKSMRINALYNWPESRWAPVGLTFVEGPHAAALPDRRGKMLVASAGVAYGYGPQASGKAIQEFTMRPDGGVEPNPTIFARYVGEGRGSIADIKLLPDGLYFTDLYQEDGEGGPTAPGGHIWRISYTGTSAILPSGISGQAPLTVSFVNTSTAVGRPRWEFGDGTDSGEAAPTHTFSRPGRYTVNLTTTAANGAVTEAIALVTVKAADGSTPSPPSSARLPAPPAPERLTFPQTGASLSGGFKQYWEAKGGLTIFGAPITEELAERNPDDGQVYTVQYFERARFEYHPEQRGTPFETQLGLLGNQAVRARLDQPPFQPVTAAPPGALFFPQTGHSLGEVFRARWEEDGGAAIFGLPISEPFIEKSPTDGAEYTVQFFERARLEHRPQAAGTVDEVVIGRLGSQIFIRRPGPRLSA